MPYRDPDHIRGKLTTLLNKQIDVLEQEAFGGVRGRACRFSGLVSEVRS